MAESGFSRPSGKEPNFSAIDNIDGVMARQQGVSVGKFRKQLGTNPLGKKSQESPEKEDVSKRIANSLKSPASSSIAPAVNGVSTSGLGHLSTTPSALSSPSTSSTPPSESNPFLDPSDQLAPSTFQTDLAGILSIPLKTKVPPAVTRDVMSQLMEQVRGGDISETQALEHAKGFAAGVAQGITCVQTDILDTMRQLVSDMKEMMDTLNKNSLTLAASVTSIQSAANETTKDLRAVVERVQILEHRESKVMAPAAHVVLPPQNFNPTYTFKICGYTVRATMSDRGPSVTSYMLAAEGQRSLEEILSKKPEAIPGLEGADFVNLAALRSHMGL